MYQICTKFGKFTTFNGVEHAVVEISRVRCGAPSNIFERASESDGGCKREQHFKMSVLEVQFGIIAI